MLVTYESLSIIIVAYVVHEAHDASLKHSAGKRCSLPTFCLHFIDSHAACINRAVTSYASFGILFPQLLKEANRWTL